MRCCQVWNVKRLLVLLLLSAVGGALHFVWDPIRHLPFADILAPFVPVNESYWEHSKLAVWPLLVYFIVRYFLGFKGKKPKGLWTVSAAAGLWSAVLSMFALHATLIAVLGKSAELPVSIATFLVNLFIGMQVFHRTGENEGRARHHTVAFLLLVLLFAAETVFTFYPPPIELFRSTDLDYFGRFPPV